MATPHKHFGLGITGKLLSLENEGNTGKLKKMIIGVPNTPGEEPEIIEREFYYFSGTITIGNFGDTVEYGFVPFLLHKDLSKEPKTYAGNLLIENTTTFQVLNESTSSGTSLLSYEGLAKKGSAACDIGSYILENNNLLKFHHPDNSETDSATNQYFIPFALFPDVQQLSAAYFGFYKCSSAEYNDANGLVGGDKSLRWGFDDKPIFDHNLLCYYHVNLTTGTPS